MECFAGGAFEFLSELTNQFQEHEHVIVYGNRRNQPQNFREKFPRNTQFIEWKNAQRNIDLQKDIKAFFELCSILKKIQKIDVLHLHSSKAGFLGRAAAFRLGIKNKVFYTAHGAAFLRMDISQKKRYLYAFLEKIADWFAGQIIACSPSEKNAFLAYGIKNVQVIENGISCEKRKEEKKKHNSICIISTGRLSYQKNPKLFNEIAEQLLDESKVQFIWCGEGESRKELKAPNIQTTGWLDKTEVLKKVAEADIYLSTSLWEGLPISVLEALSLGKPVILSDCVGNRDLVRGNGYLFEKAEEAVSEIRILLTDREKRIAMGKKSRQIFKEKYTVEKMAQQYLAIYRKIS